MISGIRNLDTAQKALEKVDGLPVVTRAAFPLGDAKCVIIADTQEQFEQGVKSAIEMSPIGACNIEKIVYT